MWDVAAIGIYKSLTILIWRDCGRRGARWGGCRRRRALRSRRWCHSQSEEHEEKTTKSYETEKTRTFESPPEAAAINGVRF